MVGDERPEVATGTGDCQLHGIRAELLSPPDSLPAPPLDPLAEQLPLRELPWKSFERLMVKMSTSVLGWSDVQEYGRPGQNQAGIDLFGFEGDMPRTCQVK